MNKSCVIALVWGLVRKQQDHFEDALIKIMIVVISLVFRYVS